jgi:hypothetical protein
VNGVYLPLGHVNSVYLGRRLLPADVQRVFDTWSSAEAMSRWFVVDQSCL